MKKAVFLDPQRCVGCGACVVACMDENDIYPEKGEPPLRRVYQIEDRRISENGIIYISIACNHCEDSPCLIACPTGAISREPGSGRIVTDTSLCIGCHSCALACPFGIPRYNAEEKMYKCTLCGDRISVGLEPACVRVCFQEALSLESANDFQGKKEKALMESLIKATSQKRIGFRE
ncbi:MAG: 4Fe-4S dicluster domain-containing protein [Tepidanaerobacteraceae bacterium]|jgi:Fe-S-cluster-containing dehydrogenase component